MGAESTNSHYRVPSELLDHGYIDVWKHLHLKWNKECNNKKKSPNSIFIWLEFVITNVYHLKFDCLFLISAQGNISESIRRGFLALDEEMLKDDSMKDELAGTTAVITVLKGSKIYCVSFGPFFFFFY